MPLRQQITSNARTVLLVLLAASILVFIIAVSNAANLILARTVRREGELGIRAALGASNGALRRVLLADSLILCGAGATLGVIIARPHGRDSRALRLAIFRARSRYHCGFQHVVGRRAPRHRRRCAARVYSKAAYIRRISRRPALPAEVCESLEAPTAAFEFLRSSKSRHRSCCSQVLACS